MYFSILGRKIVASEHIKKGYTIVDDDLGVKQNKYFDFSFLKNKKYLFIKVLTLDDYQNDNIKENEYSEYFKYIETFLAKKDIGINFTFNVISVRFQKKKKPLIEIVYNNKK